MTDDLEPSRGPISLEIRQHRDGPKRKNGAYSKARGHRVAKEIVDRLCDGESLRSICTDPHMPSRDTVYRWVQEDRFGLMNNLALARLLQGDHHADRIVDVVDDVVAGRLAPDRAKVAMDGLKWAAAKMAPEKYGDKVQHTGEGGKPIDIIHRVIVDTPEPAGVVLDAPRDTDG